MARSARRVEQALAVGSLGFAAGGLLAPRLFGRASGLSPSTARLLGARDLAVAGLLLWPGGPLALAARGVSDAVDAVLVARRRKAVAVLAATSAATSLVAAARSWRGADPAAGRGGPGGARGGAYGGDPVG